MLFFLAFFPSLFWSENPFSQNLAFLKKHGFSKNAGFWGLKYFLHLNHITLSLSLSLSLSPIPPFHQFPCSDPDSIPFSDPDLQSICSVFFFHFFPKESRPPAKTKSPVVFWFVSKTARIGGSGERDPCSERYTDRAEIERERERERERE